MRLTCPLLLHVLIALTALVSLTSGFSVPKVFLGSGVHPCPAIARRNHALALLGGMTRKRAHTSKSLCLSASMDEAEGPKRQNGMVGGMHAESSAAATPPSDEGTTGAGAGQASSLPPRLRSPGSMGSAGLSVVPGARPGTLGGYRRSSLTRKPTARVQKLRDLLFRKEAFEVLTSAEFSLKLDMSTLGAAPEEEELRNIAAIDYDRISRRLSGLYGAIFSQGAGQTVMSDIELQVLGERLLEMQLQVQRRMREGQGVTSVARFSDVSEDLPRVNRRQGSIGRPKDEGGDMGEASANNFFEAIESFLKKLIEAFSADNIKTVMDRFRNLAGEVKKKEENLETYFQAFVREDGSLDFDAVKVPKREELVKMGGELWERLNGVPPGEEHTKNMTQLKEAVKLSPRVLEIERDVMEASAIADEIRDVRLDAYAELDEFRQGGGVLRAETEEEKVTAVTDLTTSKGPKGKGKGKGTTSTVREEISLAKGSKYASRLSGLMKKLRIVEKDLLEVEQRLKLRQLDLDMERIAMYINYDIEQSDEVQDQQKLLVAEFGLLDSQIGALRQMSEESGDSALAELQDLDDGVSLYRIGLVDEDELVVVAGDVDDLMRRLGVDEVLDEKPFSMVPKISISDMLEKVSVGANFYFLGTKLMASDWAYSLTLIFKAAIKGQTLSPREVRTLRRAFKDTTTFIPFIVILIIPLSPVGHVLVFSFIQRFFPDFFPSPYTDRRQNLMKMYQAVEMNSPPESRIGSIGSLTRSGPGRRKRSTRTLLQRSKDLEMAQTKKRGSDTLYR